MFMGLSSLLAIQSVILNCSHPMTVGKACADEGGGPDRATSKRTRDYFFEADTAKTRPGKGTKSDRALGEKVWECPRSLDI